MKIKKGVVKRITILVLGIATFIICMLLENHILRTSNTKNIGKSSNQFEIKDIVTIADVKQYITEREVMLDQNTILVGKNQKELENQYFDFSIKCHANTVSLMCNKLTKQDYIKEKQFVDPKYVQEICKLMNALFSLELNEKDILQLVDMISYWYLQLRDQPVLEEKITTIKFKDKINRYDIKINESNNMLQIVIG